MSTYALDLLPEGEIASLVDCCGRMLEHGGRPCLMSLTFGRMADHGRLAGSL